MTSSIPIIDLHPLLFGTPEEKVVVCNVIGAACKEIGFFIIVNHNVDNKLINSIWDVTEKFFDLPVEFKKTWINDDQNKYPFGYSSFGGEVLSKGKEIELLNEKQLDQQVLPDLKEMFSIGPSNPLSGFPSRIYPTEPVEFGEIWSNYYEQMNELAKKILEAFAITLNLPKESYFEQFVTHHASALRALNYPPVSVHELHPDQLRASAHTDYGTITILRTDGPGLQVSKDVNPPVWVDVPHIDNGFIVNLGDLMKRWTNDYWLSTLHRVVIQQSDVLNEISRRRQSLAFFHNVNKDAVIEGLSILSDADKSAINSLPKYPSIIAGDFLMQKHLASLQIKN